MSGDVKSNHYIIIVPQIFRVFYITGDFVINFAGEVLRCDVHYPVSVFPRDLGFALNGGQNFTIGLFVLL